MGDYAKNLPIRGNNSSGMDQISDMPRASVYRVAALNITNTGATVAIPWDTVLYQSEGMWSSSTPTRLTCITAGLYQFGGWGNYSNNTVGYRQLEFVKNATQAYSVSIIGAVATGTIGTFMSVAAQIALNAGDYVELFAANTGGGALAWGVASTTDNGFQACLIST